MRWHEFDTRDAASAFAAERITASVRAALAARDEARLIVSGGSTPGDCLDALACADLPWSRVTVTLSDERCVPPDHEASNERMVRARLFRDRAQSARFETLAPDIDPCTGDFACVLLGMGVDGHFASLFPDLENLDALLQPGGDRRTVRVATAASPHPRLSMPLARLLATDALVLLAFGDDKRAVIEAPGELPVARLLAQDVRPVDVVWAP